MPLNAEAGTRAPEGVPMGPRYRTAIACALVAAILLAGLAAVAPRSAAADISDRLEEASGSTDRLLGGGDYVFVRFGADAAFGVLWGNASNPNHVYIVALKARYVGVAQVVNTEGREIVANIPVKYWTLYAVRLQNLIGFRDQNGNGIADYRRGYDGENFTWFQETDDVTKRVALNTTWTRGTIARTTGTAERMWEFNLSARNLPYIGVNNTVTPQGDNQLNLVRFTFRLRASLEEVDNGTVPNWRITVDTTGARPVVVDAERLANLTYSGKVARYNLKWDQEIVGWDFEPGANRRILLEFAAIVGNLIPLGQYADLAYLGRVREAGEAGYRTAAGNETANETSGDLSTPRRLASPYVEFDGNWTRIARFAWVSDSRVDNTTQPTFGQILAGRRIFARGDQGLFAGFVLLGGISYAPGNEIVHDPDVTTDVIAELVIPSAGPAVAIIAAAAVVAIAVFGLVLFLRRRRRKEVK